MRMRKLNKATRVSDIIVVGYFGVVKSATVRVGPEKREKGRKGKKDQKTALLRKFRP